MARGDIDEAEIIRLRKLEAQVGSLLKSPDARKKLAAAVKEVDPNDPLAKEADRVDPAEARFDALQKELREERKAREDAEAKRVADARLADLRTQRERGFAALRADKWTADGIAAVEKLMDEKGILDPLDAAAIYEKAHPPQVPVASSGGGGWNFMSPPAESDADLKALIATKGEDAPLLDRMAWGAIQEVRGQQPRR